jgi:hypothetical protein
LLDGNGCLATLQGRLRIYEAVTKQRTSE